MDEIYENALAAGAAGGKLLGAGGGGFMLLFAAPAAHTAIRERLNRLIHVPFKLESTGSQIIFYDPGEDFSDAEAARSRQSVDKPRELTLE